MFESEPNWMELAGQKKRVQFFLQYVEKVDKKPIILLFNGYETKPRQAQCSFGVKMSYKYGGVKIYSINDITN